MADWGTRVSRGIGASDKAFGGGGLNLPAGCLEGEGDMVGVFDDFNGFVPLDHFDGTAIFEAASWVLTQDAGVTAVADTIQVNSAATATADYDSCLRIFPGTADDSGGNMQLDVVAGTVGTPTSQHPFPHIWIPETAAVPSQGGSAAEALDTSTWVFACRIGLDSGSANGEWEGKAFIGWASTGDTSIMDHLTGVLTDAVGNLHGFHIPEDGSIDGISKRTTGDSLVDGTNFTELVAAAGVDGTVANGARTVGDTMWFDLALRMDITDMSDDTANGTTRFYHRGPLNRSSGPASGRDVWDNPGQGYQPWIEHGTVLSNETPNHTIALVPTIEVMNSSTAAEDCVFYLDWWSFGRNRISRG